VGADVDTACHVGSMAFVDGSVGSDVDPACQVDSMAIVCRSM